MIFYDIKFSLKLTHENWDALKKNNTGSSLNKYIKSSVYLGQVNWLTASCVQFHKQQWLSRTVLVLGPAFHLRPFFDYTQDEHQPFTVTCLGFSRTAIHCAALRKCDLMVIHSYCSSAPGPVASQIYVLAIPPTSHQPSWPLCSSPQCTTWSGMRSQMCNLLEPCKNTEGDKSLAGGGGRGVDGAGMKGESTENIRVSLKWKNSSLTLAPHITSCGYLIMFFLPSVSLMRISSFCPMLGPLSSLGFWTRFTMSCLMELITNNKLSRRQKPT